MGTVFEGIDEKLARWIGRQPMFFVATAPLAEDGHVNVSPRGLDCFSVLDAGTVAWVDLTGSGSETIAHLRENGRICVMFASFGQQPRILRLHGRGRVVLPGDPLFDDVVARHPSLLGPRAVIVVDIDRIADSCGWGVPRMELVDDGERGIMGPWAEKKGPEGLSRYRADKNLTSLDGLPALTLDEV
ncbi:pyridoxamine 5'-phosphate oxidase family protein [Microbacterium sp. NPDC019599]|uniref:pyridoxamine 5'-phosphate oxidase family protein n=1 Tax=Microbacterium sp. NPDC019599 TaxID=3154690 RepID=UPI0033FFE43F